MSKSNNNGTNNPASKSRKGSRGPRPIKTVAQLREELLKTMMVEELRKIDRKIGKLIKREGLLRDKMITTQTQLDNLKSMRTEYAAEVK